MSVRTVPSAALFTADSMIDPRSFFSCSMTAAVSACSIVGAATLALVAVGAAAIGAVLLAYEDVGPGAAIGGGRLGTVAEGRDEFALAEVEVVAGFALAFASMMTGQVDELAACGPAQLAHFFGSEHDVWWWPPEQLRHLLSLRQEDRRCPSRWHLKH